MLRSFALENDTGTKIDFVNNENYDLLAVTGLNPVAAEIGTVVVAGFDGASETTNRIGMRNITILLNIKRPIEQNRLTLYTAFGTNRKVRIIIKTDSNHVYIDGRIETFENDTFTQLQQPLISVLCPLPYFQSFDKVFNDFVERSDLIEFPFESGKDGRVLSTIDLTDSIIVNTGSVSTGFTIEFEAVTANVTFPKITNITTGENIAYTTNLSKGNSVKICTERGKKSAVLNVNNGAGYSNVIEYINNFMQLQPGYNELKVSTGAAYESTKHLQTKISFTKKYGGV